MSIAIRLGRKREFSKQLQELFFTMLYTADQYERRFAEFLKPFHRTPYQYDIHRFIKCSKWEFPSAQEPTVLGLLVIIRGLVYGG